MSAQVTVVVAGESQVRAIDATTTWADVLAEVIPGLRGVAVARVDGELVDLDQPARAFAMVEPVMVTDPDGLRVLRHSCAHVMAQAVQDVFPDAKLGIGPPIENGFYYEFDVAEPFDPEDLARIEKRMVEIVKSGQRFVRRVVSEADALVELADEPYKCRLVGSEGGADVMEVGGTELTIYDNVDMRSGETVWGDLCRGPHIPTTRMIAPNAFKVMRSSAAYWLGNQANEQLQRIYGTAWPDKDGAARVPRPSSRRPRSATTAGSASIWTSSASRTRSARGWPCSTPRAASSAARWRTTRAASTRQPGTSSSTPRTSPRHTCSRPPGTSSGTPRACTRPCTSTPSSTPRATSGGRAPTTTSSR